MTLVKVKISNAHGTDYAEKMWMVSVGEHARRFTGEQLDNGEALQWADSVIAKIDEMVLRQRDVSIGF